MYLSFKKKQKKQLFQIVDMYYLKCPIRTCFTIYIYGFGRLLYSKWLTLHCTVHFISLAFLEIKPITLGLIALCSTAYRKN